MKRLAVVIAVAMTLTGSAPESTTGTWKVIRASNVDVKDYWENNMKDNEVHFVIDGQEITHLWELGGELQALTMEYKTGEEKSMETIGSGKIIKHQVVQTTGEVEEIDLEIWDRYNSELEDSPWELLSELSYMKKPGHTTEVFSTKNDGAVSIDVRPDGNFVIRLRDGWEEEEDTVIDLIGLFTDKPEDVKIQDIHLNGGKIMEGLYVESN